KKLTVLVATSGDTGGAVAHGFYGVEAISVVILYPKGKVSDIQERQLTTLNNNVTALEVAGDFDDCQQMVKKAFADADVRQQLQLTSANSINVARWLSQQVYYFFAQQQWPDKKNPPVISVPSGNFGNICAGLLAQQSGLSVFHFIAACNANAVVPQFLQSGTYRPQPAVTTLSNAMDVGNPSNFARILALIGHQLPDLKKRLSSYSISDKETAQTIRAVHQTFGYTTDPHGAVAYAALHKYLIDHPAQKGIFLETAHPVKFLDTVEKNTGIRSDLPPSVSSLLAKEKKAVTMTNRWEDLKEWLLQTR
ncbi:MAG: threonine synthase, partial [Chitinophagaceae bacterium]